MKILLNISLAILAAVSLTACNDALDRQAVVDDLKSTDVQKVPNHDSWIGRAPNGDIWYEETNGEDGKITAKTLLFKGERSNF